MGTEHSKAEMKAEIDQIMERVGPEVVRRSGQMLFAEQQGTDFDLEDVSIDFLEDHVQLLDLKAKVEDEEEKEALSDYAREYHRRAAASLRAHRDLFQLKRDERLGNYS